MATAKLQPTEIEVAVTWHTDETDDLDRLQTLQDKAQGYPRPATDFAGRPVASACVVEHWASIDSEDPAKTATPRKRLRALTVDADAPTPLSLGEQLELTGATVGALPVDWKE